MSNYVQGQSDATEHKARGISALLAVNLRICKAKFGQKFKYFHFDLHAGSGWNDDFNVIGSPLAFIRACERESFSNYVGHFIDCDVSRARELAQRECIASDHRCIVHAGDNSELCDMIPEIIRQHGEDPRYALGSVFIDPNGVVSQTPWEKMAWLFRACPRLDVIINYPATGMKRACGGGASRDIVRINDIPDLLRKKYWLLRDPRGPWQWCLMMGRNIETGDYRLAGFVHWESEKGQDIRRTVTFTKRQIREVQQMDLFADG